MKVNKERNNQQFTTENLAPAIFTVNRHAKTATNPKYLYSLKHEALLKMIKEGKAVKVGLHFSRNPRFSQQQSDVLVECGDYNFHMPARKSDFQELEHLGELNSTSRNPRTRQSLSYARNLLEQYTGKQMKNNRNNKKSSRRRYQQPEFKRLGDSYF